ncbi:MAG: TetR/AcrR family transcriptional regulator [Gammaproteobacteria bacterium]|nr:TetR/AcrR family transcriptional regulator [Gammaproteobacteria bacterium]MCP5198850.1 TetR/AcrR family transcriptional regulator [Gammaproteobacteria bacterium]
MEKRRERLLEEARVLLARGGFEALNLRELARQAGLTVPTIYNLIGCKEDVLLAVAAGVLTEIEARTTPEADDDPLALAAAVVEESTRLFEEDEDFYRAAFLAVEWLDQGGQHHAEVARIYAWVGHMMEAGVAACRAAGDLEGRIPAALLAELITRNFRMNCRGWAFGHHDIAEFRRVALGDLYVTLCADATADFRTVLTQRIAGLTAPAVQAGTMSKRSQTSRGESQ